MIYLINMPNISFKYFVVLATQKWQVCGSEYVYFQIFKFYQILSFLCSQQYKEFHIENLHACRLHY
jgi:hypothetical protein